MGYFFGEGDGEVLEGRKTFMKAWETARAIYPTLGKNKYKHEDEYEHEH